MQYLTIWLDSKDTLLQLLMAHLTVLLFCTAAQPAGHTRHNVLHDAQSANRQFYFYLLLILLITTPYIASSLHHICNLHDIPFFIANDAMQCCKSESSSNCNGAVLYQMMA